MTMPSSYHGVRIYEADRGARAMGGRYQAWVETSNYSGWVVAKDMPHLRETIREHLRGGRR